MGVDYICKEGTDLWLRERKRFLTASSAFTVIAEKTGELPKWWSNTTADLIDEKFKGVDQSFPPKALQRMWWGSHDESGNMAAASEILGIPMARHQHLVKNYSWEFLAATPDGIAVGDVLLPTNYTGTSVPKQWEMARERIADAGGGVGVVEMKNTSPFRARGGGASAWYDYPPDYYRVQVQFQLHILEMEWGLLVGKLNGNDMSVHFLRKDPAFAEVMDELDNTFRGWVERHG